MRIAPHLKWFSNRTAKQPAPVAHSGHVSLRGWRVICSRAWRNGRADNMNMLAAAIAFYAFLALLPSLSAVAMAYALFAGRAEVLEDLQSVLAIIPGGAETAIAHRLADLLTQPSVGPMALALAIALGCYSAARGARSVVSALNVMFQRPRRRHAWQRWGLAIAIAGSGAGLLLLALFGIALQGYVAAFPAELSSAGQRVIRILFWMTLAICVSAGLALLYRFGPSGERMPWRWLAPGAIAGAMLWLIATLGFGAYTSNFDRLETTYGAAATVVVVQLWLYLSAYAMLAGAKLSAEALFYVRGREN